MRKVWFLITLPVVLSMLASGCAAPTPAATPVPPTSPPAPTATPKSSRLPDPVEEVGNCPSGEVAAPDVVDTWSPPPKVASITPLSCHEIGEVFDHDPQAPLDVQEVSRRQEEGVTLIDLSYASPMGGQVPATLVVPEGAGPFGSSIG